MALRSIFRPKWKDNDWMVRKAAIEKLNKPKKLAWIALNDPHDEVAKAAVAKIEDQNVLEEIAENEKKEEVRKIAVEKIESQSVLAKIAEKDKSQVIRKRAVELLDDQDWLARIAKKLRGDAEIKRMALEKIRAKSALNDCAKNARDEVIRKMALRKSRLLNNTYYKMYPGDADNKPRIIAVFEGLLQDLEVLWENQNDRFEVFAAELISRFSPLSRTGALDKLIDLVVYSDQLKAPLRLELLKRAQSVMQKEGLSLMKPWEARFHHLNEAISKVNTHNAEEQKADEHEHPPRKDALERPSLDSATINAIFYELYPGHLEHWPKYLKGIEKWLYELREERKKSPAEFLIMALAFLSRVRAITEIDLQEEILDFVTYSDQFDKQYRADVLQLAKDFLEIDQSKMKRSWAERFASLGVDPKPK